MIISTFPLGRKHYLCAPKVNYLIVKAMTKAELVAEISTKTGIEKTAALQAVEWQP